jgi:rubrerythrin
MKLTDYLRELARLNNKTWCCEQCYSVGRIYYRARTYHDIDGYVMHLPVYQLPNALVIKPPFCPVCRAQGSVHNAYLSIFAGVFGMTLEDSAVCKL